MNMTNIMLVFAGGGTGAVARYLMALGVSRVTPGSNFPWHTLSINILGALGIGILLEILALRMAMVAPMRLLLVTGFLGGFTTFSAFSLEAALMLEKGAYTQMAAYIAASVIGTIAAVFIGSALVRSFS